MSFPREVRELVERFRRNEDVYRSSQYNEIQLRREFIDPFFTAFGWDVANVQGYAEAYKDVVHEDAIHGGLAGSPTAPRMSRLPSVGNGVDLRVSPVVIQLNLSPAMGRSAPPPPRRGSTVFYSPPRRGRGKGRGKKYLFPSPHSLPQGERE